jgi:hypothetical protein
MFFSLKVYLLLVAACCMLSIIFATDAEGSKTSCWKNGKQCDPDTTCEKCCTGTSYKSGIDDGKPIIVCGSKPKEKCLDDGIVCYNSTTESYECDKCCNGYDDDYGICGVECFYRYNLDGSYRVCCNDTYVENEDYDKYECGCFRDGTRCIPGLSCPSCCSGAYAKNGYACGGKCIPTGRECDINKDCHLCCDRETYWYSTGQIQCGTEPCYGDGEPCIPMVSCSNCCSGGAYNGDGTVCGGTCLSAGTECTYQATCLACCQDYGWDEVKGAVVCEPKCLKDGTKCIPGSTCYACCNGAYADLGMKCGGKCLENGTKCDYHTTCKMCCVYSWYDSKMKSYVCSEYDTEELATTMSSNEDPDF